jgi:hypothetical protein
LIANSRWPGGIFRDNGWIKLRDGSHCQKSPTALLPPHPDSGVRQSERVALPISASEQGFQAFFHRGRQRVGIAPPAQANRAL